MKNETGTATDEAPKAAPDGEAIRPAARLLRYQAPVIRNGKGMTLLARSDIMVAAVQTIAKGGENNLHSHSAMDGLWFALKGRARFYTSGDELIGEIGPGESVFIPRDFPYWFEAAGDEVLEILQVEAIDKTSLNRRTDHEPKKAGKIPSQLFSPEGAKVGEGGLLKDSAPKA